MKITTELLENWKGMANYDLSINPQTGQEVDIQKYARQVLDLIEYIQTEKRKA